MSSLPENFDSFAKQMIEVAESIEGFLSPKEMQFLALAGACPRANGTVLEIGSFKGRSTFILASAARMAGEEKVSAVDPLIAPSETDPDLGGAESSEADFRSNLEKHGVAEMVDFHMEFSYRLAERWDSPIRFLWIDGDHTYKGTKADLDGFLPNLSDGAIVAIHDVLHEFEGGVRVFAEDILLSENFGASGFVGSIAWAQFRKNPDAARPFRDKNLKLYRKVIRLVPYVAFGRRLSGIEKKKYKLLRSLVPHGPQDPVKWLELTEDVSKTKGKG